MILVICLIFYTIQNVYIKKHYAMLYKKIQVFLSKNIKYV